MLSHRPHLYEESVHVPLVVVGPGIVAGRVGAQVQGIDLFPTLAALLGFPAPARLAGQDFLAAPESRPVFAETAKGRTPARVETPLVSVRVPGWKLIEAPALGERQLYDLAHDPAERHDLFGRDAEGGRLAAMLAAWRAGLVAPPPPTGPHPDVVEKLRQLGYVE
jgi:arylsulfatase A-like enzyme